MVPIPTDDPTPVTLILLVNVEIPLTARLPMPAFEVTVRSLPIVTLSGNPMITLLVPVTVSISFEVPSISKTSVFRLLLSFDPESADTAKAAPPGPPGVLSSTYF